MNTTPKFLLSAIVATLVGCGGEGASSSNNAGVSRVDPGQFSGITFAYNPAPLPIEQAEAIALTESNALEFARLALVKATAYAINAQVNVGNLRVAEDVFSQEDHMLMESCPQGGNLQITKADQNGNRQIDATDVFAVAFSNCANTNGVLQTDYASYSGAAATGSLATTHYVTARDFKATQPSTGNGAQVQGTEGRKVVLGSGRYQYIVHSPRNQVSETEAGRGSASYTMLNFLDIQGSLSSQAAPLVRMNFKEKGDVSTRLDISPEKAYTAQGEDLVVSLEDNVVVAGNLLVQSGGRLLVRALGKGSGRYLVRIGLDANSDGQPEKTCDFDYSQVLAGTASFSGNACNAQTSTGGGSSELPLVSDLPLIGPLLTNLLGGSTTR